MIEPQRVSMVAWRVEKGYSMPYSANVLTCGTLHMIMTHCTVEHGAFRWTMIDMAVDMARPWSRCSRRW